MSLLSEKGTHRPFCFKLYGYPKRSLQPASEPVVVKTTKEWKPKENDVSLIAHTSFRASSREDWYFDSGCSRRMTGLEKFLVDIKSYSTSFVTFGDGAKGEIK
ncbi:gag-pol polyprotein, partial [Trifolium medium]|nr:gag-pol polyprotein [Trifolium medium]